MLANFVQETANAPGSATTINLAGPPAGRRGFLAAFASGSSVYYFMDDGTQSEWGIGTVTGGAPNTLARTTVISNSAGTTARLNFTGSVRVYNEAPAERLPLLAQAGTTLVTTTGQSLLTAADAAAALAAIGATATGDLVGQVAFFPATAAPTGWLKANGALVSRTTYANLWTYAQASGALSTDATWLAGSNRGGFSQGDGSTTFRLPDLRGEFLRGWDDGRGIDTGRAIGTHQAQQIPAHQHLMPFGWDGNAYFAWLDGSNTPIFGSNVDGLATRFSFGTGGLGSSGRFAFTRNNIDNPSGENRPRNLALLACIRF